MINKEIENVKRLQEKKKITGFLITGDFNYGEITWPNGTGLEVGAAQSFKDTIDDNFISQLVTEKTFQTEDGSLTNTLDLVMTESPDRIPEILTKRPLRCLSKTHLTLTWDFYLENKGTLTLGERSEKFSGKIYKRGNYDGIQIKQYRLGFNV